MVCGRRVDASPLVAEYRRRPWGHAVAVLVDEPAERLRCCELCVTVFERSGLKRLLVHDGIGMGLDAVRAARVEMGAISRSRHNLALKQVQLTGSTASWQCWRPRLRESHGTRAHDSNSACASWSARQASARSLAPTQRRSLRSRARERGAWRLDGLRKSRSATNGWRRRDSCGTGWPRTEARPPSLREAPRADGTRGSRFRAAGEETQLTGGADDDATDHVRVAPMRLLLQIRVRGGPEVVTNSYRCWKRHRARLSI